MLDSEADSCAELGDGLADSEMEASLSLSFGIDFDSDEEGGSSRTEGRAAADGRDATTLGRLELLNSKLAPELWRWDDLEGVVALPRSDWAVCELSFLVRNRRSFISAAGGIV